jgi:DNA polymerase-3 subunit epsilon
VVRRAWPEQFARSGHGLANVANWCGLQFEHHRADEDARVAGEILLAAISSTGLRLSDWLERAQHPIDPRKSLTGNPEGPLGGEVVVFTGSLSLPRRDAAELAAQAGCEVTPSLTKRTTVLVVGQQDLRRLEGHEKSSKHRKAEALIAQGQPIRILGEADFRRLIELDDEE